MAEIETNNLIKIILGVLVIVAVIGGLYFFFKDSVIDFFKNLPTGKLVTAIIR